MKITKEFITILKNFSSINQNMLFVPGNKQSIISTTGSIFSRANTDVEIEKEFAIFSLSKFINVLSLFEEPNIEINEKTLTISSVNGEKKCKYQLTNPEFIKYEKEPDKYNKMQKDFEGIQLRYSDLSDIIKMADILGSEFIIFEGKNNANFLSIMNSNDNGDTAEVWIDIQGGEFKAVLPRNMLNLIKQDYEINISKKGAIQFHSNMIDYFMALDKGKSVL